MKKKYITTSIGEIAVFINEQKGGVPIIFLHGVYYNHHLWDYFTEIITDRTVITVDMPLHGESKRITKKMWTLDDCTVMLLEILDSLGIKKVVAIGHSWGSMTILRAANKAPERFHAVGFCNMPIAAATERIKLQFRMQHLVLPFRNFYSKQVAKALYGKFTLKQNPDLLRQLKLSMSTLTNSEITQTDSSVIIHADNAKPLLRTLKVPALALKGKEDYVPEPEFVETRIVEGGHVSPLEVPHDVCDFIQMVINRNHVQQKP